MDHDNSVIGYLAREFGNLRRALSNRYPRVFIILGNDDPRLCEEDLRAGAEEGLWEYVHNSRTDLGEFSVYGYSFIPPSPFLLKDWERYDVSRFVDPGCVSPEEGYRSTPGGGKKERYRTIERDLQELAQDDDLARAILLFHSPPYQSKLDRTALDGKMIDHVPLDLHTGSIAIQRFIEKRQPLLTLHGHIHESTRLTGSWRDKIGRTHMFNAAHDGPELALVRFDLDDLENARRELI
jgi:Icc-related predicted phosphoesterase